MSPEEITNKIYKTIPISYDTVLSWVTLFDGMGYLEDKVIEFVYTCAVNRWDPKEFAKALTKPKQVGKINLERLNQNINDKLVERQIIEQHLTECLYRTAIEQGWKPLEAYECTCMDWAPEWTL